MKTPIYSFNFFFYPKSILRQTLKNNHCKKAQLFFSVQEERAVIVMTLNNLLEMDVGV